jgi:hypothetical protein
MPAIIRAEFSYLVLEPAISHALHRRQGSKVVRQAHVANRVFCGKPVLRHLPSTVLEEEPVLAAFDREHRRFGPTVGGEETAGPFFGERPKQQGTYAGTVSVGQI